MKSGVIGLGYVGLPLAVEIAQAGFNVIGIEVDATKVKKINRGVSYIGDVDTEILAQLVKQKRITATTDFSRIREVDTLSICVPTPLSKTKEPDISYIVSAVKEIARFIRRGQLIILESTTYPGTTEEVVLPLLSARGLRVGKDFFLAFSPERVDPGNKQFTTKNIPKVIGGVTPVCTRKTAEFYGKVFDKVYPVSSARCAEMTKLLENTFRSVNIALVNEFALMCDKLQLNIWEVIDAAATKPFGFMPFYPGPGLGGHCIPIDPHYLSWKLRSLNYHARFIDLAAEINAHMPEYVVRKIQKILNMQGKPLKGALIFILGIAYKRDIEDTRESPAFDIIKLLRAEGAKVIYNDPYVEKVAEHDVRMTSIPLTQATLKKADCVVIVTDHKVYDYQFICDNARVVVDTRNATRDVKTKTPLYKL